MVVVLPAPFGPRMPVTVPRAALSVSPSTAVVWPYRLTSLPISTAGICGTVLTDASLRRQEPAQRGGVDDLGPPRPDIADGPAVVPHVGDGPLHARHQRFQPGYAPQHVLLEVHHQQRGALRVEDECLVAHAFSYDLPCLPAPGCWLIDKLRATLPMLHGRADGLAMLRMMPARPAATNMIASTPLASRTDSGRTVRWTRTARAACSLPSATRCRAC